MRGERVGGILNIDVVDVSDGSYINVYKRICFFNDRWSLGLLAWFIFFDICLSHQNFEVK